MAERANEPPKGLGFFNQGHGFSTNNPELLF